MDDELWTPATIALRSESRDLGRWEWRPLGRAWALQRDWRLVLPPADYRASDIWTLTNGIGWTERAAEGYPIAGHTRA